MHDTSGPSLPEPLAFFDRESWSWRMSAATFPWEPERSLETLPARGMTVDGVLFELPTWAPATAAPGSSSLPTPRATRGGSSTETVELLRTPQASVTEPKPGIKLDGRTPADPQVGLIDQVLALLPTPVAQDDGKSPEAHMAMKQRMAGGPRNGITSLSVMARQAGMTGEWDSKLLPTPEASDGTGGRRSKEVGGIRPSGAKRAVTLATALDHRLLPTPQGRDGDHTRGADPERYRGSKSMGGRRVNLDDMIAATKAGRFSGEPTAPPSSDTPPCSDDPHPTLWTDEAG